MNLVEFYPILAKSLVWTLLHSLWQGTILFVLLLVMLTILKKKSPQVRYLVLCSALMILVGSMITTFWIYLPDSLETAMEMAHFSDEEFVLAFELNYHDDYEKIFGFREVVTELNFFIHHYAKELMSLWLFGALLFALRWFGSVYYTYQLRQCQTTLVSRHWQREMRYLAEKMGVNQAVTLLESAKVDVPMVIGHLKPVILIPIGTLSGLNAQQVEAILVHELAHIRRYDFLVNLLLSSLEIVLFYHPVFWWLSNKILQEREQCCDDIAVSTCGNAQLYARTLLLMEEKRQQNSLAMAYQGKKQHLLNRIKRICLSTPATYREEMSKAGLALSFFLLLAIVTWARMPVGTTYQTDVPTIEEPDFDSDFELEADGDYSFEIAEEPDFAEVPEPEYYGIYRDSLPAQAKAIRSQMLDLQKEYRTKVMALKQQQLELRKQMLAIQQNMQELRNKENLGGLEARQKSYELENQRRLKEQELERLSSDAGGELMQLENQEKQLELEYYKLEDLSEEKQEAEQRKLEQRERELRERRVEKERVIHEKQMDLQKELLLFQQQVQNMENDLQSKERALEMEQQKLQVNVETLEQQIEALQGQQELLEAEYQIKIEEQQMLYEEAIQQE